MKRKLLTASAVISYIFTFIYAIVTALFYSVNENIYWLFLVLMIISVCLGLYNETLKTNLIKNENKFSKKDKIVLIVLTVLSVVNFPAFIFDLLALTYNKEDKYQTIINPNYKETLKKEKKILKSAPFILTIIALSCIIIFGITGNIVETNGGQVKVTDYTLTKKDTDEYNRNQPLNGTSYTIDDPSVKIAYTVYRPKKATSTNPYPVVFVVPGFTRTKATMSQYAIELARRGAVVFTIDPGSQGGTSYGGYQADEDGNYIRDENGDLVKTRIVSQDQVWDICYNMFIIMLKNLILLTGMQLVLLVIVPAVVMLENLRLTLLEIAMKNQLLKHYIYLVILKHL